jgi:thiamine biosynthesis lipoprotein
MQPINKPMQSQTLYKREIKLMGTRFEFSIAANEEDEGWANNCIDAAIDEVRRIEMLLTSFSDNNQTYLINKNAGKKPVQVDKEVFYIIKRFVQIQELSNKSLSALPDTINKTAWYYQAKTANTVDNQKAQPLFDYNNIILDEINFTVYLKRKGMHIGLNSTGKGYAAERATHILKENWVERGIVNAAGNIVSWGFQQNKNIGFNNIDTYENKLTTINTYLA